MLEIENLEKELKELQEKEVTFRVKRKETAFRMREETKILIETKRKIKTLKPKVEKLIQIRNEEDAKKIDKERKKKSKNS